MYRSADAGGRVGECPTPCKKEGQLSDANCTGGDNTTTTNNNIRGNVYGAVIMAEPLREFTQFI